MDRRKINRICGVVPVVFSLAAFLVVIAAIVTGWERGETDEGAMAHIFQLLIVAQVPFILVFLVTADWERFVHVARPLVLQVLAVGLAFGLVAFFKL